jgi:hypothetical protein
MEERLPSTEGPLALSLIKSGCNGPRAKIHAMNEGYGMIEAPAVCSAYEEQNRSCNGIFDKDIHCEQCKPGTNTFTYRGSAFKGRCCKISVDLRGKQMTTSAGVLCLDAERKLQYCDNGDFLAVSHVWSHGWQTRENWICSRVFDMLLKIAVKFKLKGIWLDIAMVSNDEPTRTMSIDAMNCVYSKAAFTLVCDRLLLSMERGTDRERALALILSDWFTRVWTMQEAILSKKLVVLQRDGYWTGNDLLGKLMHNCSEGPILRWEQYGAIYTMCGIIRTSGQSHEQIFYATTGRRTTKKIDMTRALFPLFKLKWPGSRTTFEDAQITLLNYLGQEAGRYAFAYGPIGLPAPWRWAPLCFSTCSGILMNSSDVFVPTERGLKGEWSCRSVLLTEYRDILYNEHEEYVKFIVENLGCKINEMDFITKDDEIPFSARVYHMETDLNSWYRKRLILLAQPSDSAIDGATSWYRLGSFVSITCGRLQMDCVGSVSAAGFRRSQFLTHAKDYCGILS